MVSLAYSLPTEPPPGAPISGVVKIRLTAGPSSKGSQSSGFPAKAGVQIRPKRLGVRRGLGLRRETDYLQILQVIPLPTLLTPLNASRDALYLPAG